MCVCVFCYLYIIHKYLNYFRTRLKRLQVTPSDWSSCDRYVCRANLASQFLAAELNYLSEYYTNIQLRRAANRVHAAVVLTHSRRPFKGKCKQRRAAVLVCCRASLAVFSGHKIMKKPTTRYLKFFTI